MDGVVNTIAGLRLTGLVGSIFPMIGRVYFSNEWYKGQIYCWLDGKVAKHSFHLYGYDHLSDSVPVPGMGSIYMIHAVSGKGRVEECLLKLDMDTGRCQIASVYRKLVTCEGKWRNPFR